MFDFFFLPVVPSAPPQHILASVLNSRTLNVTWEPPIFEGQNGEILSYRVIIEDANRIDYDTIYDVSGKLLEKTVGDLLPFHLYSIKVAASTSVGLGPSAQILIKMPEDGKSHLFYLNCINWCG